MDELSRTTGGLSLRRLLPDARFVGADDIQVTSCANDSRACRAGDLFVALKGSECDGHDHAIHALARGARALLVERPLPAVPLPACIVPDSREAYGRLCQALAGNPSERLKLVGITGTNGKTTTSCLAASVLQAAGIHTGLIGTLGSYDGCDVGPANLTTPPAPELARLLARMEGNGCTHCVLELSSHALCQSRAAGAALDVAAITNIRHDHLDYHGTLDDYRAAKAKCLDLLKPEGMALFNVDDEATDEIAAAYAGPALTVGIERAAEVTAVPAEQFLSEQTFLLTAGYATVPVRTHLIGCHNIYNCLLAAAIGMVYRIDLTTIVQGLEAVTKVPGRLERIECGQDFGVFVDYAHTADALAGVLDTLRPLVRGRLVCVFGAGGDRDRWKRPQMGRAVESRADLTIVTTDNPRHEDPRAIADQIVGGCRRPGQVKVQLDRAAAIHWALEEARGGDCVLIAGKGHESCQIVGDERHYFDDRELAREWLYSHAAASPALRASA